MWKIPKSLIKASPRPSNLVETTPRREFHDYFVTHLPSSSLHPDSKSVAGPHHRLPRDKSTPHEPSGNDRSVPAASPMVGASRELTVVRIPLRSAKHHFGVSVSRGTRPYNEDTFQAGTIDIPAFAKRQPVSITRNKAGEISGEATSAEGSSGDPQVFYFGVFDGHGGSECSGFLREELHEYIEGAAKLFELESSLRRKGKREQYIGWSMEEAEVRSAKAKRKPSGKEVLDSVQMHTPSGTEPVKPPEPDEPPPNAAKSEEAPPDGAPSVTQSRSIRKAEELERQLMLAWKDLVGGYFRRFKPAYFSTTAGGQGHPAEREVIEKRTLQHSSVSPGTSEGIGIETVLEYAFLKADYDFVSAQVGKQDEDPVLADRAINDDDILGHPSRTGKQIGGKRRFKGGSTCSIALISTPTPATFWVPSSSSTIITAHCGDTRIILCETATGKAVPLTSNHHTSLPAEADRLRRYAATFVTDSFGEERIAGLANTRAFGDMASKRVGVSAEPEIRRFEVKPAQYSFMVLISDGVSGSLTDQEIVDIVKEARTPEQGARDVTSFATEVVEDADNATTLVVRLGGWERRIEGGLGSLGTKDMRDWRRNEANEPRRRM